MKSKEHVQVAIPDGTEFSGFGYPCSVVVLPTGRLLATFTGIRKGRAAQAVGSYSDDGGRIWSTVVTLFGGDRLCDSTADIGESYADPCVVVVNDKCVMLFCVSLRHDPDVWDLSRTRFWRRTSDDGGNTFGPLEEMPRHKKYYVGTANSGIRLGNGTLVLGYSWDIPAEKAKAAKGEGGMDLVSGVLVSRDEGMTWQPGGDCHADTAKSPDALEQATNGLDEPAIVELPNNDLFMLGRTGTRNLWQSFSRDAGQTWEQPVPSPLISHNCPAALLRLADDSIMAVYNNHPLKRVNLSVSVSRDGCRTWSKPRSVAPVGGMTLETHAAYPCACQLADGTIVIVFYQIEEAGQESSLSVFAVRSSPEILSGIEDGGQWKEVEKIRG